MRDALIALTVHTSERLDGRLRSDRMGGGVVGGTRPRKCLGTYPDCGIASRLVEQSRFLR